MLDIDVANERILNEYIDGPTIYDLVKNDTMKDLYLVQMREMAKVVYDAGLNIDYFPTNFIVQDEKIFYIDYECNNYMDVSKLTISKLSISTSGRMARRSCAGFIKQR